MRALHAAWQVTVEWSRPRIARSGCVAFPSTTCGTRRHTSSASRRQGWLREAVAGAPFGWSVCPFNRHGVLPNGSSPPSTPMAIRASLLRAYWRMAGVIVPEVRHSQFLYEDVVNVRAVNAQTQLDLGCGRYLMPPWRQANAAASFTAAKQLVGLDPDFTALAANRAVALRCQGLATNLPFANETFDLVTANMVLEHLRDPVVEFREVSRVMKSGGVFVFHTPNARGYPTVLARLIPEAAKKLLVRIIDGRPGDEVYPAYYRANTPVALAALARASGMEIVDLRLTLTTASMAAIFPPALVELFVMRLLTQKRFEYLRTTIVGVIQKKTVQAEAGSDSAGAREPSIHASATVAP